MSKVSTTKIARPEGPATSSAGAPRKKFKARSVLEKRQPRARPVHSRGGAATSVKSCERICERLAEGEIIGVVCCGEECQRGTRLRWTGLAKNLGINTRARGSCLGGRATRDCGQP